jgi:S1-C subfamily serine protease
MSSPPPTCPSCDAVLRFDSALPRGSRTRCRQCGATIPQASSIALPPAIRGIPPVRPEDAGSPLPPPLALQAELTRNQPGDPPSSSDRPGDRKKAVHSVPVLVGVIGVTAVALVVFLFIVSTNSGDRSRDRSAHAARPSDLPVGPSPEARPKDSPSRADPPTPPTETKPTVPVPPDDKALPFEVAQRVKSATLCVRVQAGDEGPTTGSGFFEQSSGLVVTNAHVVGMYREGAAPPRKLEVVLHSGAEGEAVLPAQVVAVHREADLALLRVPLSSTQKEAIALLPLAAAGDLADTQSLYVAGCPNNEKTNRSVVINPASLAGLQRGPDGTPTRVQVTGTMRPGNAGGPVLDKSGNVVGVAVPGLPNASTNFAIPSEAVLFFLQGRVTDLQVAAEASARDGKLIVPVLIQTSDPRKRITRVALDYWTGPERPPLPPSDRPPRLGNLNSARQTVEVTYDADRSEGHAELVLDAMPARGMQLWVQPVLTIGSGEAHWLEGTWHDLAAPINEKPALLAARHRVGSRAALLTSVARFKLENRSGKEQTFVQDITARLNEKTLSVGTDGGAQVRLTVEKFDFGVSFDGVKQVALEQSQTAYRRDIGSLALEVRLDARGNLTSKKNDLGRVPLPSREILQAIGDQIQKALDIVAIPQPGPVKPGQSWQARRELPLVMPDSVQTAVMNVTYTYRGLREHEGRSVAVLELRGTLAGSGGNDTLSAKMTGTALIDQETGVVLKATALTDAALTIRSRAETVYATGTLDVRLTREAEGK